MIYEELCYIQQEYALLVEKFGLKEDELTHMEETLEDSIYFWSYVDKDSIQTALAIIFWLLYVRKELSKAVMIGVDPMLVEAYFSEEEKQSLTLISHEEFDNYSMEELYEVSADAFLWVLRAYDFDEGKTKQSEFQYYLEKNRYLSLFKGDYKSFHCQIFAGDGGFLSPMHLNLLNHNNHERIEEELMFMRQD